MLNDFLRDESKDSTTFLDEVVAESNNLELSPEDETGFLGMTPTQRFIISFMFFLMVVIIGAFFLLMTGVIAIPVG
jgi:hypothetical protein